MSEDRDNNVDVNGPEFRSKIQEIIRVEIDILADQAYEKFESALRDAATTLENSIKESATDLILNLENKITEASTLATTIATTKGTTDQTATQIQDLVTDAKTTVDEIKSHRDTVTSLSTRAEELNNRIDTLTSTVSEATISAGDHEKEWNGKFTTLFEKIEALLPGATGAGLASGFRSEKENYERKHTFSRWAFICFLVLIAAALFFRPLEFSDIIKPGSKVTAYFVSLLLNLPLVGPAIWGAWWFNRHSQTYDRLAEEYRQKETISTAFSGYIRELDKIEGQDALNDYLKNALAEICVPAGRVYDKKSPTASPIEDHIEKIIDAVANRLKSDTP